MNAIAKRILFGAAAGLAGSIVLQGFRLGTKKLVPSAEPPIREHPGKFMLDQAEKALPRKTRRAVQQRLNGKPELMLANLLGAGYGVTFGALLASAQAKEKRIVRDGILFGLATWAVGYLGWLPATGLMPPIWKHKPKQIVAPLIEHSLYGIATAAAYQLIQKRASDT